MDDLSESLNHFLC